MINLYHLKYFLDAAKLGSLSRAAKINHVSSPAISLAIKNLEDHFGQEVLVHKKNQFQLTRFGRAIVQYGPSLLGEVDAFTTAVKAAELSYEGSLIIGTQQSIADSLLPEFSAKFTEKYPKIEPRIRLGTTKTVKHWIENKEVEVAFCLDNVELSDCESRTVYEGDFVLVSNRVCSYKLADGPYILTDDTSETKIFSDQYRQQYKYSPRIRIFVNSWGVIKRHVIAGLGIGLIPDYKLEKSDDLIVFRKLPSPEIPYLLNVYHLRNRMLSNPATAFIKEVENYFEKFR